MTQFDSVSRRHNPEGFARLERASRGPEHPVASPNYRATPPGTDRHRGSPRPGQRRVDPGVYRRRRLMVGAGALALVGVGWVAVAGGGDTSADRLDGSAVGAPVTVAASAGTAAPTTVAAATTGPTKAEIESRVGTVECTMAEREIRKGDSGESVRCAQEALQAVGFANVQVTSEFDATTDEAVKAFQSTMGLFVDGLLGKNTAEQLGVWPGAEAFIVRTPPPAAGATDLWGNPLSQVASAGESAPPLPENAGQGTGKRVVYDRNSQRVWAIDDQERIVRSYLVSGSRFRNEVPGEHTVYSKTENAYGWDLKANLPFMIRYTKTDIGNIGFHAIPSWRDTGEKLQTEDELGTKLSAGCTRQAPLDAQFLWYFAEVGTRVLVL